MADSSRGFEQDSDEGSTVAAPSRRFRTRTFLLAGALAASSLGLSALPRSETAVSAPAPVFTPMFSPPPAPPPSPPRQFPLATYDVLETFRPRLPDFLVEPGTEPTFRMSQEENDGVVVDASGPEAELYVVGSGTPTGGALASAEAYRARPNGWERIATDITANPIPSRYQRGTAANGRLILGGYGGSELYRQPLLTAVESTGQSRTYVGGNVGSISSVTMFEGRGLAIELYGANTGSSLLREDTDGRWTRVMSSSQIALYSQVAAHNGTVAVFGVKVAADGPMTTIWTTTDLKTFRETVLERLETPDGSSLTASANGFSIRTHQAQGITGWESDDGLTWSVANDPDKVDGVEVVLDGETVRVETPNAVAPRQRVTDVASDPLAIDVIRAIKTADDGTQFVAVAWRHRHAFMVADGPTAAFRPVTSRGLPRRRLDQYRKVSSIAAVRGLAIAVVDSAPKTTMGAREDADLQEVWFKQGDQVWRKRSRMVYDPYRPVFVQKLRDGILVRTATGYRFTVDGETFTTPVLPDGTVLGVISDANGAVAVLQSDAGIALAADTPERTWTSYDSTINVEDDPAIDVCLSVHRTAILTQGGTLWVRERGAGIRQLWQSFTTPKIEGAFAQSCALGDNTAFVSFSQPSVTDPIGYLFNISSGARPAQPKPISLPRSEADIVVDRFVWISGDRFAALGREETGPEPGDARMWTFDGATDLPPRHANFDSPELDAFSTITLLPDVALIGGESNDAPAIWTTSLP